MAGPFTVEGALARTAELLVAIPRCAAGAGNPAAAPGDPRAETLLAGARRRWEGRRTPGRSWSPGCETAGRAHVRLELAERDPPLGRRRSGGARIAAAWAKAGSGRGVAEDGRHPDGARRGDRGRSRLCAGHPLLDQGPGAGGGGHGAGRGRSAVAERLLRERFGRRPPTSPPCACWPKRGSGSAATPTPRPCSNEALAIAPSFAPARHTYAIALYRQQKAAEAIPHVRALVGEDAA